MVILYADDLKEALESVKAAGGKIAKPPFDSHGGSRSHLIDPDGYEHAVRSAL